MSKYFQVFLTLLYVLLTMACFLIVLETAGVRISGSRAVTIMAAWVLCCFCSAFIRTPIDIFLYHRLRRPVWDEETKLLRCYREVSTRANFTRPIRLRVSQETRQGAFVIGYNTLAVSAEAVRQWSDREMKGVIAHEVGHLKSGDCIVAAAFVTASALPRLIGYLYHKVLQILVAVLKLVRLATLWTNGLIGLGLLLLMAYLLFKWQLVTPLVATFLFILLFNLLNKIFRFFRLLISRFTEYRQDGFAHRLGYGAELREALIRLSHEEQESSGPYHILMNGTHPDIFNRIRKLEQQIGMS